MILCDLTWADSTSGKIMEKLGNVLGSDKLAQKGSEKRAGAGNDYDNSSGGYGGSSNY